MQMIAGLDTLFEAMLDDDTVPGADIEISRYEMRILIGLFNKGEITMGELARSLSVPLSTATRAVDRLVRKQLTERIRSDRDRRIVLVRLSAEGQANGHSAMEARLKAARGMLKRLEAKERAIFLQLFSKMTRRVLPKPEKAAARLL